MGRYYFGKKNTVEDCRSISISFLKKHGYLDEPCCRSGAISWTNYLGEETSSIGIMVSGIRLRDCTSRGSVFPGSSGLSFGTDRAHPFSKAALATAPTPASGIFSAERSTLATLHSRCLFVPQIGAQRSSKSQNSRRAVSLARTAVRL